VGFGPGRPTPGVEGVVQSHALFEHRVVVSKICGEAQRDREESVGLLGKFRASRVCSTDDGREALEAWRTKLEVVDEGVEAALIPNVREGHAGNVVRLGTEDPALLQDLCCGT